MVDNPIGVKEVTDNFDELLLSLLAHSPHVHAPSNEDRFWMETTEMVEKAKEFWLRSTADEPPFLGVFDLPVLEEPVIEELPVVEEPVVERVVEKPWNLTDWNNDTFEEPEPVVEETPWAHVNGSEPFEEPQPKAKRKKK